MGRRAGVVVGLALVAGLAVPAVARACSCVERPTPAVAIAGADVVFEARVEATGFVVYEGQRTRLAVTRMHKGVLPRAVDVGAAKVCALGFRAGERWLVYAHRDADGRLTTSMCTRSAPLRAAIDDLAFLGNPRRAQGVAAVIADGTAAIDVVMTARARPRPAIAPVGEPPLFAWLADLVAQLVGPRGAPP